MIVTASGVHVVSKSIQVWRDGDQTYRAVLAGSDGTGLLTANVETKAAWDKLVEMDVAYDMDVNVETNGYKHYVTLVGAAEA